MILLFTAENVDVLTYVFTYEHKTIFNGCDTKTIMLFFCQRIGEFQVFNSIFNKNIHYS